MFPIAGGLTMYDWVSDFLAAGQSLHGLLSERADVDDTGRKNAGTLRTTTIGLLNRCRAALADEMNDNAKLPRNLDQQVFAYFDELETMRATAAAAAAAAAKVAKAAKAAKDAKAPAAAGTAAPAAAAAGTTTVELAKADAAKAEPT